MSILKLKFFRLFFMGLMGLSLIAGCKNDKDKSEEEVMEETAEADKKSSSNSGVFTITTKSMEFSIPKDTLLSGWNTIRYKNNSNMTHFVVFEKYPEGKGLEDAEDSLVPVFQNGMDLIIEDKMDAAMEEFGKMPEWFSQVVFSGGTGLVSPNTTTESTIKLEPGTYIIECYIKMPGGRFHSTEGMVEELYVKEEKSELKEPAADYTISISGESGIEMDATPSAGEHVFKVNYADQKQHENFAGHDVHLVRVEPGSDLSVLSEWMVWTNPEGFMTPAPQGYKFVGGMQEMPGGNSGYFKANLQPGNYVLISEVPNQQEKDLLKEFEVK
ncbi:hypothetical protein [Christiangramia crocea]|uniref:DUF4198 domain-containing protein n=1 Tax=Christiangramia crocea TaxID=2904124 RepID=A0A9X1UXP6_9FLAO|nr:hypothetical protein [Gramella crocea]MCG9971891.1 hypothetical protein [Gramella crocea]